MVKFYLLVERVTRDGRGGMGGMGAEHPPPEGRGRASKNPRRRNSFEPRLNNNIYLNFFRTNSKKDFKSKTFFFPEDSVAKFVALAAPNFSCLTSNIVCVRTYVYHRVDHFNKTNFISYKQANKQWELSYWGERERRQRILWKETKIKMRMEGGRTPNIFYR